ncbi:MAG: hypothetical protein V4628_18145 [Pseudomonadota bacterium]
MPSTVVIVAGHSEPGHQAAEPYVLPEPGISIAALLPNHSGRILSRSTQEPFESRRYNKLFLLTIYKKYEQWEHPQEEISHVLMLRADALPHQTRKEKDSSLPSFLVTASELNFRKTTVDSLGQQCANNVDTPVSRGVV